MTYRGDLADRSIPLSLAAYRAETVDLGAGGPGKHGQLVLTFAKLGNRTRLTHAYGRVPFAVPRALYPDPAWPDLAAVYVAMPTGGIVQGDRLDVEVRAFAGACAHVTTQAATKVYGMTRNCAVQTTSLFLERGAYVEFWPDPVIPFGGSRFAQQTRVEIDPEATLIYRDIVTAGRVARGERFDFEVYAAETMATSPEHIVLFVDSLRVEPRQASTGSRGVFGRADVLGTVYVVTNQVRPDALANSLDQVIANQTDVYAGVSALPSNAGVIVRALGPTTTAVLHITEALRATARRVLNRPPASVLRK